MEILKRKLSDIEISDFRISDWPIWTKEVSEFDWYYDAVEDCFILDGIAEVVTAEGEIITFGKDDFMTFPQGLSCHWKILRPIKKHYRFR